MVYPKSDDQRQSLSVAVSKSFLFRSLDKEQSQEVLDAMFEKRVSDNFGELLRLGCVGGKAEMYIIMLRSQQTMGCCCFASLVK